MTTRPTHWPRHRFLGISIAFLLFLLLILPAKYALLFLTREGLRIATTLGVMDETNGLGGQILGYNYFRHPDWAHWLIGLLAAAVAFGVPFACCLLLARRFCSGRGRPTLCGNCGVNIDNRGGCVMTAQGLQCPACQTTFAERGQAATSASLLPRYILMRLLVAFITIGAAHVFLDRVMTLHIQDGFLRLGEATGSQVFRISGMVGLGTNGPFSGQDAAATFWNIMYRYGPTYACAILAGLVALATYALVSGPLGRTRLFRYHGPTRCGGCNYNLANLKSPRCPECGKVLSVGG